MRVSKKSYFNPLGTQILNAPIYIHWSTYVVCSVVGLAALRSPLHGLIAVLCYFGIIVVHEYGHAYAAHKLNYRVEAIYLYPIHGSCIHEEAYNRHDDAWIIWGGVLAQILLSIVSGLVVAICGFDSQGYLLMVTFFLVGVNLTSAAYNLIPVEPMDGAKAWQLLPWLFRK